MGAQPYFSALLGLCLSTERHLSFALDYDLAHKPEVLKPCLLTTNVSELPETAGTRRNPFAMQRAKYFRASLVVSPY